MTFRNLASILSSVLCTGLLLPGCLNFVSPRFDVGQSRATILAVPFRDSSGPRSRNWYGLSPRGELIVQQLREWAEDEAVGRFAGGADARATIERIANWPGEEPTEREWRDLVSTVDADLILIGEIVEFRHKQPGDVALLRGSAAVRYQILDRYTGREIYATPRRRSVRYPRHGSTDIPLADVGFQNNRERIEIGLSRELGKLLGRDLYGYYED